MQLTTFLLPVLATLALAADSSSSRMDSMSRTDSTKSMTKTDSKATMSMTKTESKTDSTRAATVSMATATHTGAAVVVGGAQLGALFAGVFGVAALL